MPSRTPVHASLIEQELDIYDSTSDPRSTLTITSAGSFAEAQISTNIRTTYSPENTTLNPPAASMACSNQSRLDSNNSSVASSTSCPEDWDPLRTNPLLLGYPRFWENPVSLIDTAMANGIFVLQGYGPDIDLSLCQLPNSFLHPPQIDRGSYQESPLPHNNQAPIPLGFLARPLTEISQGGSISTEGGLELATSHGVPFHVPFRTTRLPDTSRVIPSQLHLPLDTLVPEERSYDRPGKKRPAQFQPDPLKLEESCRRVAGSTFAVDWIIPTFKYGVSIEALHRDLERKEIDVMDFPGGFEPHQAYDGFISKVGERYECGLCKEGNRTRWKHKKDAPRHLRKFHFGLADVCKACGKGVFNTAEMKTHRCVRRVDGFQAESSGV